MKVFWCQREDLSTNVENISKIGSAILKIEGQKYSDLIKQKYISGNAFIDIISNRNNQEIDGFTKSGINLKEGSLQKWFIGKTYDDISNIERFVIKDESFSQPVFFIDLGSNQVDIKKLRLNSQINNFGDGFVIGADNNSSMVINNQLDSPMHFQINNTNKLTLLPDGNFGIGNSNPTFKLHVNGTAKINQSLEIDGTSKFGLNGTAIHEIIKVSSTFDLINIPSTGTITQLVTINNAKAGSTVHVSPSSSLPDGIVLANARVSTTNTVEIKFSNITASAINPPSIDYYVTIIR